MWGWVALGRGVGEVVVRDGDELAGTMAQLFPTTPLRGRSWYAAACELAACREKCSLHRMALDCFIFSMSCSWSWSSSSSMLPEGTVKRGVR